MERNEQPETETSCPACRGERWRGRDADELCAGHYADALEDAAWDAAADAASAREAR